MSKAKELIEGVANSLVEGRQKWFVHMERVTVAPGTSYDSPTSADVAALMPYLKQAGLGAAIAKDVTSIGYDDISIMFSNPSIAVKVGKRLDKVVPRATSSYRSEFGVRHNVAVSGPYDEPDLDPGDNFKDLYSG